MLGIDKIYNMDCIQFMRTMDNNSVDLVIADPPYFRIKNEEWDKFRTLDDYLRWSREWISLCTNKLRLSGTLILYGCTRSFSVLCELNRIMLDNGMYFVEEIILDKGIKSVAGRISQKIKMLPPVTENILVYRKDAKPFVKQLLNQKQKEYNYSAAYIKQYLGMATNGGGNWTKYCGNTEFPLLPTREHWNKLRELFSIEIDYDSIEETYNSILGITNVWNDIEFYNKNRKHPCEKPVRLAERIISLFSREGDLVYVPFSGSGNDFIACNRLNRRCIATEINSAYIEEINI